ncbi:MAG: MlaD family protein [Verrucomicrobiota bacterium]|nr:MlaD family protein [Verrucomicrobiota bacterium]
MKKNLSDYLVALGVIACSAVLLAALTFALSGWRGGLKGRSLTVEFPDITGIKIHSEVRYAGAPAGRVIGMRLLTAEERLAGSEERRRNAVRVILELAPDVPPIPADTRVIITSDTLLSEKFIGLSAGSPEAGKLDDGAVLYGNGAASFDAVLESIGPFLQSLGPLLESVEETLSGIGPLMTKTGEAVDAIKNGMGDALPRISKLADGLRTTSDAAERALQRIENLVAETEQPIQEDLREVKKTLTQLQSTLRSADQLIGNTDRNLGARMQELSIVLQNLKVVSTYAKELTRTLSEKPNRLIFGGKSKPLPSEAEILRSKKPVRGVEALKR